MDLVYFSSVSEQTKKFVEKLGFGDVYRIPLRKGDPSLEVSAPYVLITPTYGAGRPQRAVPPQVIKFLNEESNRLLIQGVVAGGNRNYGACFGHAGDVISQKCNIPLLGKFEVTGLPGEAEDIEQRIRNIG